MYINQEKQIYTVKNQHLPRRCSAPDIPLKVVDMTINLLYVLSGLVQDFFRQMLALCFPLVIATAPPFNNISLGMLDIRTYVKTLFFLITM